ncbi:MAG: DUF721 domain-containing protein [Opitutales bacterium]|nr:DUF721 domain-containing protein [Opitutales bacterium]
MKFNRHIRNLIADFRALPREDTRAYLRLPKTVGTIVKFALNNLATKRKGEHVLLENWQTIIGEKFCKRCYPVTILSNDVLLVSCANGVIRSELEIFKSEILVKIVSIPQCSHIRDIRFNISNS